MSHSLLKLWKSHKRPGPDIPTDYSVVLKKQAVPAPVVMVNEQKSMRRRGKKREFKSHASALVKGPIAQTGPELKAVDTSITNSDVNTTCSITLVNGIAEGGSVNQRDGRMVKIKYVWIRGLIQRLVDKENRDAVRIALVWDNAPNGVIATAAQLGMESISEFPEVSTRNRFTYLLNRVYCPGQYGQEPSTAHSISPDSIAFDHFLPVNAVTQYQSSSTGIADIQNGALYFCVIGANTTTNGSQIGGSAVARVVYVDI